MIKNTKKLLFIIVVLIAAVLIALTALVKIFITPEKVKTFLIPEVEHALNRKISIGEINIGLFKGVEVKDLAIKEIDGETDFVKCRDFVLQYKLFPLLFKKLFVNELTLLSPEIRIARSKEGRFNFEDIGKGQEPEGGKKEKQDAEFKKLPVYLQINKIIIRDARFSLTDLKGDIPDIKGSFNINTGIKSVSRREIFSQGEIDLKLDEVLLKKTFKKYKDITAGLKYALSMNLESGSIKIDKADLRIQEIPASISGTITNLKTSPEIDIAVLAAGAKAADIQKSLASFFDIKGLAFSGNLTADLRLRGMPKEPDSLKIKGRVILEKISIAYNNINAVLDGNLKFNEQIMDIDIKSTVGKNSAELKGAVSNYFKNSNIKLNLYSKQLFLDEVLPAGTTKGADAIVSNGSPPVSVKISKEAEPINPKLTAEGEIKIDSAKYKNMTMSNFYAKYQLKNSKLEIIKMTALAGKGRFNMNSIVDLSKSGYTYNLACNIDSLHADEVVNAFFPKAKDTVFGSLSADFQLNGAGTLPETIKRNLSGDGDFNIKDGKITNNKMLENLALFLGIDELRTINLRQAHGTVKIRNSVARLDSIFLSDDVAMDPSGSIGLDETLDLAFDLKLSPRLTKKAMGSSIAKYIKDEEGWGMIPLKVSGTFAKPSYIVDIAKAGKRVIKKEVDKFIDKLFKKDKETGDVQKQEEKKSIEDLLKGIFK